MGSESSPSLSENLSAAGTWAFAIGTSIGRGSLVVTNHAYLKQAGPSAAGRADYMPGESESLHTALARADAGMYENKKSLKAWAQNPDDPAGGQVICQTTS